MKTRPSTAASLRIGLVLTLTLALLAALTPAQADTGKLAYHRAELNYPDGQHSVLKRIRNVARDSCPRYGRVRELAEIDRCQQAAIDDLVAQIADPEFTAFAQASTLRNAPIRTIVASH